MADLLIPIPSQPLEWTNLMSGIGMTHILTFDIPAASLTRMGGGAVTVGERSEPYGHHTQSGPSRPPERSAREHRRGSGVRLCHRSGSCRLLRKVWLVRML